MSEELVTQYLDQQSILTAVENFSVKHDLDQLDKHASVYKELIPNKEPDQDQQYAFEVDLDKCTGCKACVTACHNENGLDVDETWRSVGIIQGGTTEDPAVQHITTACHHCAEPACMHGCPTKAYTKDPQTGIVKHLDDQCFGCQYCILKCPYEVPKYNKAKGIVHKCDMCINRLTAGQAPACVRACPTGAIRITIVDKADLKKNSKDYVDVPDSPSSDYTFPSTKYKTNKRLPDNMMSFDYFNIKPEHSHLPLVFMLVLTQLSVGAFLAEILLRSFIDPSLSSGMQLLHILTALSLGLLALASSILHLGRPQYAFRAILGLKTSWLSREILAFGIFAKLAILYAVSYLYEPLKLFIYQKTGDTYFTVLPILVFLFGLVGVYCSIKVYKDTKRPFWDNDLTTAKFILTMGILGFCTILLSSLIYSLFHYSPGYIMDAFGRVFCMIILVSSSLKMLLELSIFSSLAQSDMHFIKKSAILMTRQLKMYTWGRFIIGCLGGIILPIFLLSLNDNVSSIFIIVAGIFMFIFSLIGELLERYLFFRAVVPLKMPGANA